MLRLEATPADAALRREFELWLGEKEAHSVEYQKVRHTWSGMGRIPHDAHAGGKRTSNVSPLAVRRSRVMRWMAAGAAVTAACLALVLFPVIQKHVLADYTTGTAELREIVLPDGSVVYLDAGSAIAVGYAQGRRSVTLIEGQAFFSVVGDNERPFTVVADEVSVTVTGTAFDVRKTPHNVFVGVQSGSVEVTTANPAKRDRLTVGQRMVFDRQLRTVSRGEIAVAVVASWRARRLIVYDAIFADVVEELGRHMPGAIVIQDSSLNRLVVSGIFDLARPREALEGLAISQHAKVIQITPYLTIVSAP